MSTKNSSAKKVPKKTVYIDVDEEITAIIDKVSSVSESVVALVVPKRATVFDSIVNLKLLKRSATQNKKRVVLITSDKGLLPLAGLVGLHTATSLSSKPFIPKAPEVSHNDISTKEESVELPSKKIPETKAVAGKQAEESIKLDQKSKAESNLKQKVDKIKKDRKLKVPNFGKFRLLLISGVFLLLLLIGFGYWALIIAPKAEVNIRGETDKKDLSFKISANTDVQEVDREKAIIPSLKKEITKTESEKVPATGEEDKGNQASGEVTLINCSRSDGSVNIPAGTGVSNGQLTYITQEAVELKPSLFSGGGICLSDSKDVDVIAEKAGDKYNVDEKDYEVNGFSGVRAEGSKMTGGTSDIVRVVSESDINKARSNLESKLTGATEELKSSLKAEGYIGLEDTITSQPGQFIASPSQGTEANEVTVTVDIVYSMLGIDKSSLEQIIDFKAETDAEVNKEIESILDNGLNKAKYQLGGVNGPITEVNINTTIITGPEIKEDAIKSEIAGLKRGEAENRLSDRPGIDEVIIETSPFWVNSIPNNVEKIQIKVEESQGQ